MTLQIQFLGTAKTEKFIGAWNVLAAVFLGN